MAKENELLLRLQHANTAPDPQRNSKGYVSALSFPSIWLMQQHPDIGNSVYPQLRAALSKPVSSPPVAVPPPPISLPPKESPPTSEPYRPQEYPKDRPTARKSPPIGRKQIQQTSTRPVLDAPLSTEPPNRAPRSTK